MANSRTAKGHNPNRLLVNRALRRILPAVILDTMLLQVHATFSDSDIGSCGTIGLRKKDQGFPPSRAGADSDERARTDGT